VNKLKFPLIALSAAITILFIYKKNNTNALLKKTDVLFDELERKLIETKFNQS